MSDPLKPREGFCSFLDKRTKIKTAEGLFALDGPRCKSGRSTGCQSFALLTLTQGRPAAKS